MTTLSLSKKNTARLLEMIENRYGDVSLSEIRERLEQDEGVSGIKIVTARAVYGKKATFVKKQLGLIARPATGEWMMLD